MCQKVYLRCRVTSRFWTPSFLKVFQKVGSWSPTFEEVVSLHDHHLFKCFDHIKIFFLKKYFMLITYTLYDMCSTIVEVRVAFKKIFPKKIFMTWAGNKNFFRLDRGKRRSIGVWKCFLSNTSGTITRQWSGTPCTRLDVPDPRKLKIFFASGKKIFDS